MTTNSDLLKFRLPQPIKIRLPKTGYKHKQKIEWEKLKPLTKKHCYSAGDASRGPVRALNVRRYRIDSESR